MIPETDQAKASLFQPRGKRLDISVAAEEGSELEVWSARQKADLLQELTGGDVRFRLGEGRK